MYDHNCDSYETDDRNDIGHASTCGCPRCMPEDNASLEDTVASILRAVGIRCFVESTGPTVLVTLYQLSSVDLAWEVLRGYDVASDGAMGLRVGIRGEFTAVEEERRAA